jgi:hypothetical protein
MSDKMHVSKKRVAANGRPSQATCSAWFKREMKRIRDQQADRIRKAGKHDCVAVPAGVVTRVTGRGDRILKRPVVVMRFYECKVCGRDMTPNHRFERRGFRVGSKDWLALCR